MKKIYLICSMFIISLHLIAQTNSADMNGVEDEYCTLRKEKNLQYSSIQVPIVSGWIYDSIYSDEFDGSTINSNKWWRWNKSFHNNNLAVGYLKENVTVNNGKLILSAHYNPAGEDFYHNGNTLHLYYNTGAINSNKKIQYGYFEVECYLPKNHKFRPCFWTYRRIDAILMYNEVDVFEIINENNSPYMFQQNAYTNLDYPDVSRTSQKITCSDSITGKTIRFGVEVLPYEIVYYVNGHVSSHLIYKPEWANKYNIYTCSNIMKMIPMEIVLSFTLTVDNGMPLPYEDFTAEYFRCYKLARGNQNTYHPLVFTPSAESCKVYPNVILGGTGYTAVIDTSTAIWAEQSIVLNKGFELQAGNTFSARVIKHGTENPETSPLYIGNYIYE